MLNAHAKSFSAMELPKPPPVARQIFDQLAQAILSAEIAPESLLPSERILAEEFNVADGIPQQQQVRQIIGDATELKLSVMLHLLVIRIQMM